MDEIQLQKYLKTLLNRLRVMEQRATDSENWQKEKEEEENRSKNKAEPTPSDEDKGKGTKGGTDLSGIEDIKKLIGGLKDEIGNIRQHIAKGTKPANKTKSGILETLDDWYR